MFVDIWHVAEPCFRPIHPRDKKGLDVEQEVTFMALSSSGSLKSSLRPGMPAAAAPPGKPPAPAEKQTHELRGNWTAGMSVHLSVRQCYQTCCTNNSLWLGLVMMRGHTNHGVSSTKYFVLPPSYLGRILLQGAVLPPPAPHKERSESVTRFMQKSWWKGYLTS